MARALELARRADHRTSPNPMVGAVILDSEGGLAGEGFHERAGGPHAEAVALAQAGPRARGGTAYVTLEPCSHHGRTPPCADALLAAGVRTVHAAMEDPDPRSRGRGIDRLRSRGVAVEVGDHAAEARSLNEHYVTHRTLGRPFITLKWAMTLDGRIATATGDSRWVTGDAARAHAHGLRHEHDAILVGVNTVLLDDPELSARHTADARQPLRAVLDSNLRTPAGARVARPGTVVYTTSDGDGHGLLARGVEIVHLGNATRRRVPLERALHDLAERGILGVLVEGGSHVHGAFLKARLFDRVVVYVAPKLIGGTRAPGPTTGPGIHKMAEALNLRVESTEQLGDDLAITARPY